MKRMNFTTRASVPVCAGVILAAAGLAFGPSIYSMLMRSIQFQQLAVIVAAFIYAGATFGLLNMGFNKAFDW